MKPIRVVNFIIFLSTNFVRCSGFLMYSSRDGRETEWIYIVLNVWLLTLITMASWRYFHAVPHTRMHRPPPPSNIPLSHLPLNRFNGCPVYPDILPPPQIYPALPISGNWGPQYHTHIYCNGSHEQHGQNDPVTPDNGPRDPPHRRPPTRRRRRRRRGRHDLSPERYRRYSPRGSLSSVSYDDEDSNEPAPVPTNTPENISPGSQDAQDEDSGSVNSYLSSIHRNGWPRVSTPRRVIIPRYSGPYFPELRL